MKSIRKNNALLAVIFIAVLMVGVFFIPERVSAIPPEEECICGNKAIKFDSPIESGETTKIDGVNSVTIDVDENKLYFDWNSNFGICAVIVKGGPDDNVYQYNPPSYGDTGLYATENPGGQMPNLSNIVFCFSTEDPECPTCSIVPVEAVCEDGVEFTLHATVTGGTSPYEYSWSSDSGGTFSDSTIEDPTWTPPSGFTSTATLTLTVTANDCESSCDVKVTVYEKPDCTITAPDSVCDELTGNIASTIAGYKSYIWVIANGTITSGQGTDIIKFDITPGASTVTIGVTVIDENDCENYCEKVITVNPLPDCHITGDTEICDDETTTLCASDIAGASYSWTGPGVFTSGARCITVGVAGTYSVTITDECGESTCSVDLIVKHCEECKCSLVVLKRDEAGHPIDGAVFEVNGIQKTITGGEARWDNLECNTTYEVKEISPEKVTRSITLGDCGERSTLRVVNKGEEYLEVLGIMEVLPFTGPAIPYSPFIGISTVLAGTFLYILSKPKKKR